LIETRLQPARSVLARPDCAVVALGSQPSALSCALVCNLRVPVASPGAEEDATIALWLPNRCDVDKSGRFHAYSQRRLVEDWIMQDLPSFWPPRSSAFTPLVMAAIRSSGPNCKAGKRFRSNRIRFAPRQSGTV